MNEIAPLLLRATWETLQMVGLSAIFCAIGGLALGLALVALAPGGIEPKPRLHRLLVAVTNFARSVPFLIVMVALVPVTRFVVGTSIGTAAAIVPLVVAVTPFVARLIEGALLEVDPGILAAVETMGATPWQMIVKVYLPEAVPALIRATTVMTITLVGYSAMAGAIGGGGLGDLAIRYGYQRFRPDVTASTVIVLVMMVQVLQFTGDSLVRRFDRRA